MTNQDKIESSTWSIGEIKENNNNLNEQISDENKIQSQNTSVGLITASEYIRANNDITNCGNMNLNNINRTICKEKIGFILLSLKKVIYGQYQIILMVVFLT